MLESKSIEGFAAANHEAICRLLLIVNCLLSTANCLLPTLPINHPYRHYTHYPSYYCIPLNDFAEGNKWGSSCGKRYNINKAACFFRTDFWCGKKEKSSGYAGIYNAVEKHIEPEFRITGHDDILYGMKIKKKCKDNNAQ